jgi:hypothetical protein
VVGGGSGSDGDDDMQFYTSFHSALSGETKCLIQTDFKIPFQGFFIVVHETWKIRGEIRYNFGNT